uniref:Uncharacterized protein n=1 Tax=Tanacetum cinerariifolium TaxID=118510 RepID=A0A6L2LS44_TANCI|nr:hypothetical protein [Tanacetum cinerariifolium]
MTSSNKQMHNDFMGAGSKKCPPMLASDTPVDDDNLKQPSTVQETYLNMTPEKQALIDADAEAVHMILNGIGNDIYSTVDACTYAMEMWIAIERLQQGQFINI